MKENPDCTDEREISIWGMKKQKLREVKQPVQGPTAASPLGAETGLQGPWLLIWVLCLWGLLAMRTSRLLDFWISGLMYSG